MARRSASRLPPRTERPSSSSRSTRSTTSATPCTGDSPVKLSGGKPRPYVLRFGRRRGGPCGRPVTPLRRKRLRIDARDDLERVLVVDLLEYLVRQRESVHLPEGVALAV